MSKKGFIILIGIIIIAIDQFTKLFDFLYILIEKYLYDFLIYNGWIQLFKAE